MDRDIHLPIKIVLPREEDIRRPEHGGGSPKVFGEVTPEVRDALDHQVGQVIRYFEPVFRVAPDLPAVARVVLKPKALAKSHRPTELFNDDTCPVIGAGSLGVLYVSARPEGLRNLSQQIRHLSTRTGIANISTIHEISPYTVDDALRPLGRNGLRECVREGRTTLKFRLFRHRDSRLDAAVDDAFLQMVDDLRLPRPQSVRYAPGLRIFRLSGVREENLEPLGRFVGTQSLTTFPTYRIHQTASLAIGPLDADGFPPPVATQDYPIIGVVDSGIDPSNPLLAPWVVEREVYVAGDHRDYDHGTFVAGLAVHADLLNSGPGFPAVSSLILDVQAMPASGTMTEDQLLSVLEEVLSRHPDVKVWNLSLSRNGPCSDQGFSTLAAALDRLQDQYDVTFVVAAGNYDRPPFRGWPPDDLGEADRIAPPGDSVRALTVGSLAHLDSPDTRVRRDQPSPFSRRGPGPVFIPKPEVVHYGGNCTGKGTFIQTGVVSVNPSGQLAENIGTSFSTPMVATLLANIQGALSGAASRNLTKALLIHSAVLGSEPLGAADLKYRGFGVPGDLHSVLTCNPWAATMIFETTLVPGLEFERWPFPIPPCLRGPGGVVRGEFLMTLVYDPPLDPCFGAEYCRANVDVSLGTYDAKGDAKRTHKRQIPPEPKDINSLYERALVEHGFKWSPVKVFRRHITKGVHGQDWRLKVTVNHRSGFTSDEPQEFALVVTLRDPARQQPVYDEVVSQMQHLGWLTQDLQVHERVREQL